MQYICADCLSTFKRPERRIIEVSGSYEEVYYCPVCGSENFDCVDEHRKENGHDKYD